MKTPAQLIEDLRSSVGQMEAESASIFEYSTLLGVLLAGGDADTVLPGIHRLITSIRTSADVLGTLHHGAAEAVRRLERP